MHGYAITARLQVSEDLLRAEEGSLYPALLTEGVARVIRHA